MPSPPSTNGPSTMTLRCKAIPCVSRIGDIRYENGKEELYHTAKDDHEWNNLALDPSFSERLSGFRKQLLSVIPRAFQKNQRVTSIGKTSTLRKTHPRIPMATVCFPGPNSLLTRRCLKRKKKALQNELWKTSYFKKNPTADTNGDGIITWPEFHAHKKTVSPKK